MGFIDDLETRLEQAGQTAANTVGGYFDTIAKDPTILLDPNAANGNRSQVQINAGLLGSTPGLAAASGAPKTAANAAQVVANPAAIAAPSALSKYMPYILIGGALLAVVLLTQRRRG